MIARRHRPPRRRAPPQRDQHESAFAAILTSLRARVPGVASAMLVDFEGETVDYSGRLAPYATRRAAAHGRIVLDQASTQPSLGAVRWLAVRTGRASFHTQALPDGYALVVVFTHAAGFLSWKRAVAACSWELGREASWAWKDVPAPAWYAADVVVDARQRPARLRIDEALVPVEILGALVDALAPRERGWRIRVATGAETTLVREPGGIWYADTVLGGVPAARAERGVQAVRRALRQSR